MLASRAVAILLRDPPIDPFCPDTSDLDFLVLADIDGMRTERLRLTTSDNAATMLADITWLPWEWINDSELAATRGWVPHRLLSSTLVWDCGKDVGRRCDEINGHMYRPDIQRKRTSLFLDIASDTVREVGLTWHFPALGLFWLHMGHAACLAAMLEGRRRLCPNVFTRPFDYIDEVDRSTGLNLRSRWIKALHLDADPALIVPALRRVHAVVAAKFPEPDWPAGIRQGTRFEYRYWLSPDEVEWRIRAASEMAGRGESAGAVFYLRFCAYASARIPMVHARSMQGMNVSFLRPEQAVHPELQRLVPEIIGDLQLIFAGRRALDRAALHASLSLLRRFRADAVTSLRSSGATLPELKTWIPFQPQRLSIQGEVHERS